MTYIGNAISGLNQKSTIYFILLALILITVLYFFLRNRSSKLSLDNTRNMEGYENEKGINESNTQHSGINSSIILYYVNWCPHSRNFIKEWEKFELWGSNNLKNIKVEKIQCEDGNEAVCMQKGIDGYPTVMLYLSDGSEIKYDGNRTVEDLIQFVSQYE